MQHREYSELRKRIQSFRDFPNKAIDSQKLAEAGFFFAGDDSDSCLCFWCGVCLHRWEPTDDPWEEHQKVDGKYGCDFLKYRGAVPDNLCETKPTSSGDITQYHPPSRPRNPPVIHNIHNFHESKPEYNREFDRDRHYSSMPKSRFYESTDKNKQYLHLPTSQTPVTQTSNNSSTSTAGGHHSSISPHLGNQQNNMSSNTTGGYMSPLSNHLPHGGFGGEITYSSTTAPIQSQQNNMSSSATGGYIPPLSNHLPYGGFGGYRPPLSNHLPHGGFGGEITYSSTTAPIQSQQNNMSSSATGGYIPPLPNHLPHGGFGGYRPPLSNHLPHGGFGGEITYSSTESTTAPIQSQQNNMSSSATGGYIPPLPNHLPHGGFGGYRPPLSNHLPHGGFGGEITYSSTTAPILSQQNNMSSNTTGGYMSPLSNPQGATSRTPTIPPKFPPLDNSQNLTPQMPHRTQVDHLSQPLSGLAISNPTKQTTFTPPTSASARALNQFPSQPNQFAPSNQPHLPHGGFGGDITYSSTTAPILSQQNNMSSKATGGYILSIKPFTHGGVKVVCVG